jgi:hypothetical protein
MPVLLDAPARPPLTATSVTHPLMDTPTPEPRPGAYPQGTHVEVRNRFDSSWGKGFEVAEVTPTGYLIRRSTDGTVLPSEFVTDEVRKERRRSNNWWV